jgi:serine/threonine-protein kinase
VISALERTPELAKYELLERIGVGGMATVYRARDRRLGREVAVKLIHPHLRESAEVGARFVSEARAVARLRHPNVVEVFDVSDQDEAERYLVVELVRGTTLRSLLSRHKRLPPELAAAIGLEVAAALSHAHHQEIVHRDVKPENVLVELVQADSSPKDRHPVSRPRVKLTDFGIAKLLDAQGVTSTGQVLGSPAHMAPEQIEGGDVGPRADVFALGVMLYECMVGRLPFDGKNPAQVLRRVLEGVYPPAVREQPLVGALYGEVLAKALVREPAGRYASIEEFSAALRAELERVEIHDGRAEIERFLSDQDGYEEDLESRLVEALVRSGERARKNGEFHVAAAQFNRALTYRPGDPALVQRASHLARRERWVGVARRTAVVGGAVAVICGGVAVWSRHRAGSGPAAGTSPGSQLRTQPASRPDSPENSGARGSTSIESAENGPLRPHPVPVLHEAPRRHSATAPSAAPATATRNVMVDVAGPIKGGYLKIDGVRKDLWFGVQHELTVGPHTFEFVPADSECCRSSPPLSRTIQEGADPDHVVLTVAFRDARLRVDRAPDGVLECRSLFGGDLTVPGSFSVPMSHLSATGICTLRPQDPSALGGPVSKEVTLTAGQTTEVSWP